MSKAVQAQSDFLLDFSKLIQEAHRLGFQVTAGELLRTIEQQRLYLKEGKTKMLHSMHLTKHAGDLNFFKDGVWINGLPGLKAKGILQPLGDFWESLHHKNKWGGNFKSFLDCPHFERTL